MSVASLFISWAADRTLLLRPGNRIRQSLQPTAGNIQSPTQLRGKITVPSGRLPRLVIEQSPTTYQVADAK